eukprot:7381248-Prymnesium_polylepis.2
MVSRHAISVTIVSGVYTAPTAAPAATLFAPIRNARSRRVAPRAPRQIESGDRGVQPAGDAVNIGAQRTLVCRALGARAIVLLSTDGAGSCTLDRALPCLAPFASVCTSLSLELTRGTCITRGAAWLRLDLARRARTASTTRIGLTTGPAATDAIVERQLVAWAQCVASETSHGLLAGQLQCQCKRAVRWHRQLDLIGSFAHIFDGHGLFQAGGHVQPGVEATLIRLAGQLVVYWDPVHVTCGELLPCQLSHSVAATEHRLRRRFTTLLRGRIPQHTPPSGIRRACLHRERDRQRLRVRHRVDSRPHTDQQRLLVGSRTLAQAGRIEDECNVHSLRSCHTAAKGKKAQPRAPSSHCLRVLHLPGRRPLPIIALHDKRR